MYNQISFQKHKKITANNSNTQFKHIYKRNGLGGLTVLCRGGLENGLYTFHYIQHAEESQREAVTVRDSGRLNFIQHLNTVKKTGLTINSIIDLKLDMKLLNIIKSKLQKVPTPGRF